MVNTAGPFRDQNRSCCMCSKPITGGSVGPVQPQPYQHSGLIFHHECWNTHYSQMESVIMANFKRKIREGNVKCDHCGMYGKRVWETMSAIACYGSLLAVILVVVGGLGMLVWNGLSADDKVTYCYIEYDRRDSGTVYALHGNREWADDANIGVFTTMEQAVAAAALIHCPIN